MTNIEKAEIKSKFSLINMIMKLEDFSLKQRLEMTSYLKRELRKELSLLNKNETKIHYLSDGCGYWYKEFFNTPFSDEEKKEFIDEHWCSNNSIYDCTGRLFTAHIAVCNVNTSFGAKSVAYHFVGIDI